MSGNYQVQTGYNPVTYSDVTVTQNGCESISIGGTGAYQTGTFNVDGNAVRWQNLTSNGGDHNQVTTTITALAISTSRMTSYYYLDNSGILEVLLNNGGSFQYFPKN